MTKRKQLFDVQTIAACGHALWRSSLVNTPLTHNLHAWMTAPPRAGDLMLEISTFHRGDVVGSVGLFDRIEERAVCLHEANDANRPGCSCGPEDRYLERYTWLITGIRGKDPVWRHRWYNAELVRIPRTRDDNEEIARLLQRCV